MIDLQVKMVAWFRNLISLRRSAFYFNKGPVHQLLEDNEHRVAPHAAAICDSTVSRRNMRHVHSSLPSDSIRSGGPFVVSFRRRLIGSMTCEVVGSGVRCLRGGVFDYKCSRTSQPSCSYRVGSERVHAKMGFLSLVSPGGGIPCASIGVKKCCRSEADMHATMTWKRVD
jgi:hypothetical protein